VSSASDRYVGIAPVISRHAATHITLCDDADLFDGFAILNYRLPSRSLNHASLARHVPPNLTRTGRRRFDWFHHIATTTHLLCFLHEMRSNSFWVMYNSNVLENCQVTNGSIRLTSARVF